MVDSWIMELARKRVNKMPLSEIFKIAEMVIYKELMENEADETKLQERLKAEICNPLSIT